MRPRAGRPAARSVIASLRGTRQPCPAPPSNCRVRWDRSQQAPLAPKGFITGAEYKWITIYSQFADMLAKGQQLPNFVRGGYDKDYVQNTAYGAGATPEAIAAADAAKADVKALKPIFVGPLVGQPAIGHE